MTPTLFDPAILVGRHALWKRESRRCKWRLVGTADTSLGASMLMRGGGDYITTEDGADPNEKRPTLTDHEAVS